MSRLKVDSGDWIVVCDGTKALILENVGDRAYPNMRVKEVREQDDPRASEQGADAPSRAFASVHWRHAQRNGSDGLAHPGGGCVSEETGRRAQCRGPSGKLRALAIVAPPRALGVIRQAYSAAPRSAVMAELARDYVNVPVDEIEKRLFG